MGACEFATRAQGMTVREAFEVARERAEDEHGCTGYTGTIAEKGSFVEVEVPEGKDPREVARAAADDFDDKWGPAGAVCLRKPEAGKPGLWLFFGVASE